MTLGARLKQYRMGRRLSQEKVAERLGVSRQAVTKWENDQTMPSAENLLALASLYEVPMEDLVGNYLHQRKERTILRTNLTILAILWQAATLNVCIYMTPDAFPMSLGGLLLFKWIPLAASTLWMAHRLHDEKNPKQYWKNVKIESLYCALQFAISVAAYYSGFRMVGTAALLVVCLLYLYVINPQYMNRTLVKPKQKP